MTALAFDQLSSVLTKKKKNDAEQEDYGKKSISTFTYNRGRVFCSHSLNFPAISMFSPLDVG